jgi:hypothetical protein
MEDLTLKFFGMPEFDKETEKKVVKDNMDYLKTLSVKEFTFRKKWDEIHSCYSSFISNSDAIKAKIWRPTDINNQESTIKEIEFLKPRIVIVDNPTDEQNWLQVRLFCHSAEYEQTPGRYVKILVLDQNDKILGFCAIASDIPSMKCRDEFIGWSKEIRMARDGKGTLLNSAVGTTIAPTQPLGYNFLGGKLIAAMLTSKLVRDYWFQKYNNVLVGITTTSLYENEKKNQGSQYDGMEWCWKKCGVSAGKVPIKPDESIYKKWHYWIKENNSEAYLKMMTQKEGVKGPVTSAKMRILNMIFSFSDIKTQLYNHGFSRGVYFSSFYENTKEFLCGKIKEENLILKPRFAEDINGILNWWKPKATNRYKKLREDGRLNPEKLFYNGMYEMTYERAKDRYFKDVGR